MTDKIVARLKHIIAEELDVNLKLDEIDETAFLFEEGIGLDSVAIMDFLVLIEEHYGFQFSDEELNIELFRNLQVLAELISTKRPRMKESIALGYLDNNYEQTGKKT
jgi:acyl carrier protein